MKWKFISHVWLSAIAWTVALQAPLSMESPRQEYRSGNIWASPFSRDLPDPGIEPTSPEFQADSLPSEPQAKLLRLT